MDFTYFNFKLTQVLFGLLDFIIFSVLFQTLLLADRDASPKSVGGKKPATLSPPGLSPTKAHCVWA